MKSADCLNFLARDSIQSRSIPHSTGARRLKLSTIGISKRPGFSFSLKVPRSITHEKMLLECGAEFGQFVDTADVTDNDVEQNDCRSDGGSTELGDGTR